MTPAGAEHGIVAGNVYTAIRDFVLKHRLGTVFTAETGFVIARDPDTVLAPDVAFVAKSRLETLKALQQFFPGAPDLAVEVMSPWDRVVDVDEKVRRWLVHGCGSVWIVSPSSQTATVYHSGKKPKLFCDIETIEDPNVLPGFSCNVATFFDLHV